jgi:hypothetical protein
MKKVKKFGRGGDVLTALGAGLAGYGAYKYFTRDKDKDKDDSSGASLKKPTISEEVEKAQKGADKPKPSSESSYAPENKFDVAKQTGFTGDGKDDKTKPLPAVIKKKKVDPAPVSNSTDRADDVIGAGIRNARIGRTAPAAKKAPSAHQNFLSSKAGLSGKGITTPGSGDKKGSTAKGRSENPIQGTIDNAGKSMARTPQQKMAENARLVEERRKKKAAEGNGMKKGGSVSSASKRADGIAIRGKTRA